MRLESMSLKNNEADLHIFRPHEYELVLMISEVVKNSIISNNISGAKISPAEGWSDAHRY
jgi:hypothetical protein